MILPDQVILGVVPQLNGVIPQNFEVICPAISQKRFYFAQINLGKIAFFEDFLERRDPCRVLHRDLILDLSKRTVVFLLRQLDFDIFSNLLLPYRVAHDL